MQQPEGVTPKRPGGGCVRAALAVPLLVVIAPVAALKRAWARSRRGGAAQVHWEDHGRATELAGGLAVLDLTVDVAPGDERSTRAALTELMVRVAEALHESDDVYHQVVRLPWEDEPRLEPLGPQVQMLGERVDLVLGHPPFAGRTVVWLTLPRRRGLAEAVDPVTADPEASDEPALLVAGADARWAAAAAWVRGGAATVFRVLLFLPPGDRPRVEPLLVRLRSQVETRTQA